MNEPRFEFGANWRSFLSTLDEERIAEACRSLVRLLQLDPRTGRPLAGRRFLDLGSGSGLFSLAARRLGAEVTSIDVDPQSVACTQELRLREGADTSAWTVLQGSILDTAMMGDLGVFDVVYSWGVLHHTGELANAIDRAAERVAPGGRLALAIYNDQGGASRRWRAIKQTYRRLPSALQPLWVTAVAAVYEVKFAFARLAGGRNPLPFADWKRKKLDRGMSAWHDWVDWIGGLPFEVATPEQVILPLVRRGFQLVNLSTVGAGWGCNEYVFVRSGDAVA